MDGADAHPFVRRAHDLSRGSPLSATTAALGIASPTHLRRNHRRSFHSSWPTACGAVDRWLQVHGLADADDAARLCAVALVLRQVDRNYVVGIAALGADLL